MSDLDFYYSHVESRLDKGMTINAAIAASITADATRYPSAEFTLEQVAVALTSDLNPDPSGVVTRLVTSLQAYVSASGDILVSHKLNRVLDTDNPGTIDLGNFLQRQLLLQLAANVDLTIQQADVDALLALVEVPVPVTEQEVADAIQAKADEDAVVAAREAEEEAERVLREGIIALREVHNATANGTVNDLWSSETIPTKEELALALEAQATAVRNYTTE